MDTLTLPAVWQDVRPVPDPRSPAGVSQAHRPVELIPFRWTTAIGVQLVILVVRGRRPN